VADEEPEPEDIAFDMFNWHEPAARQARRRAARWRMPLFAVAVAACLAGGIVLIVSGSMSHPPAAAPLPVAQFAIGPGTLGKLPPLRHGNITVNGAVPGRPGERCRLTIARSRLVIPSLCIDGPVVPTDQQRGGALSIPDNVREIALWTGGAPLTGPDGKPLQKGTTLLAGHVDYYGQGDGTLYNLYQIQPGALVYTCDAAGHVARWRVTKLVVVLKTQLPPWAFAGTTGPRRLVLVTCGGPLDYVRGYGYTYRDNVIAVAVPA
jgi:hypothetical protein